MAKTKNECAKLVASGAAIETFHHVTLGHFNISALRIAIKRYGKPEGIYRCPFAECKVDGDDTDALAYLTAHREIDPVRQAALTDEQLEDPLIFLLCPPGANGDSETHLLVDGIHRLCERHKRGMKDFAFYLIPLAAAPRIDMTKNREIKWGEKDLVPGVGLVTRS